MRAQWEQVNFVVAEAEREHQFRALIETCDSLLATRPNDAQALTWCGIVQSSYAGAAGGLGALKHAKAARKHFQRAIDIDRGAVNGAALTSLGTLYAKVPGWPVGFGNDKKARQYLEEGLQANPEGMDSNFFMAEFLADQGETEEAKRHLQRALQAPGRPGRAISDTARRKEVEALLAELAAP
ncbi:tetratricopeptide repeat protein [Haliea sp.]